MDSEIQQPVVPDEQWHRDMSVVAKQWLPMPAVRLPHLSNKPSIRMAFVPHVIACIQMQQLESA